MFFKNKKGNSIFSVVNGKLIDIATVNDPVFSTKVLGDGVAILPSDGKIVAPVNGEILTVFPTNHAFGMQSEDGMEILIHVGIDSISLEGQGFKSFVSEGKKVKTGDIVLEVDLEVLSQNNIDSTIMLIVSDTVGKNLKTQVGIDVIAGKTKVISY
ncbi:hypothetical protein AN639_07235 [Candidatus Epulonipiscium fishelsonii]|uniref:Uncharacterized protein n=1 Tax=Candidatus Epulonipiscium fishelsonii TaxID=77094 RepID=A0ACC8XA15_9FIRM|nr:hypothetical protein AN639_07235 [Epulopiscium sp. SCG-B05WGA-EpuloA1]ONI39042.1 hypothetical protein AN396_09215 [Epulopiscium sp. SCG-B11WGA-EpuloA1]